MGYPGWTPFCWGTQKHWGAQQFISRKHSAEFREKQKEDRNREVKGMKTRGENWSREGILAKINVTLANVKEDTC